MRIDKTNTTSFNGQLGLNTLAKFRENLSAKDYEAVKKFKLGKKNTIVDILVINNPKKMANKDDTYIQNETFALISDMKKPNMPGAIVKLANAKLAYDMNTFKLLSKDVVKFGEKILAKNNK